MNFNYEEYVRQQLNRCKYDLDYDDLEIKVATEQIFDNNNEELIPNSIYVVIKYLSSDITYESTTIPVQMLILCEENNLERTQVLLNKFAKDYNWKTVDENSEFVKQQYSTPVVLNNFNEISYGWRSVMYLTGTLVVMENIVDVKSLTIDAISISPVSSTIAYSMSGNTQPLSGEYLSTTVKSVSTLAINFVIPFISNSINRSFIRKAINVALGNTSGNVDFAVSFTLDSQPFSKNMKLISATITTAPNQVPSLQLGFMV